MNCISDDNYLRDIVVSFILAGRDTMAAALTTFFFLLAHHPQVVSKIRQEFDQVMSLDQEVLASYNQIREMHYLHAAVNESLRLYPPVQFDSKFAQADDILADGTYVNKGTRVTYHPYAMGRMEKIWGQDFMEFKPERWLKNGMCLPTMSIQVPSFSSWCQGLFGQGIGFGGD